VTFSPAQTLGGSPTFTPVTVNVTLVVTAVTPPGTPAIAFSQQSFNFTLADQVGNSTTQDFFIKNPGTANLTWQAYMNANPLFFNIITPGVGQGGGGTLAPGQSSGPLEIVPTVYTGLGVGTYNGSIQVTSNAPAHATVNIPVQLTITAAAGNGAIAQ
jgi:hypothetical protein